MVKIGYARVSTIEQNLDLQIDALKNFGCDKIYTETKSGAKDRPVCNKILSELKEGDTLVVWKLDRLGRSLKNLIHIIDNLNERKITLSIVKDGIYPNNASGRLLLGICAVFAEFERNINSERTKAGLEEAVRKGKILGRPRGISQKGEKLASQVVTQYCQGISIKKICLNLNISTATMYKYLRHKGAAFRKDNI